ncbi:hypothetical protein ACFXTH_040461 [Malus domestica]
MSRMTCTIADSIAQYRGSVMPSVLKFVPRRPLGTKSGSFSEMLAIMKSNKVDSAAKVALRLIPSAAETDSPTGKEETGHVGSCEKSTKLTSRKVAEICVLLKPDLLEDIDVCAKYNKVANEVANIMTFEAYFSVEEIKRLDSDLVALKGSNISAPISPQLEIARQDIVDLKTKLDAIQVKYESEEKEIRCYIPQIQDLEFAVSELRVLKINESLENEVDELQRVRVGLLEEDEQLNVGEVGAQAGASRGEALDDATANSVVAAKCVAIE